MATTIAQIQTRRGTAAQWTADNPALAAGEIGFETDTGKIKIGNGATAWTALDYLLNVADLQAILDGTYQPLDSDLTAIAALATTPFGRSLLEAANAAALRTLAETYSTGQVDSSLAAKAPLASPALSGTPTAPTAAPGTDTTQVATTEFVTDAVDNATYVHAPFVEPPKVGAWVKPAGVGGTTNGVPNGEARWLPLWLPAGTYDAMVWDVTAGGSAGSVHRGLLYLPNAAGDPHTLALDTGQVDGTTAAVKTAVAASPLVLTRPSLVWGSVVLQGDPATKATLRTAVVGYQGVDVFPFLQNNSIVRNSSNITGLPPATLGASGTAANAVHNFGIRRSA